MRRARLGLGFASWRLSLCRAAAGLAALAAVASGVACSSSSGTSPGSGDGSADDGALVAEGGGTPEPDAGEPGPDATLTDAEGPDSTVVGVSDGATDAPVVTSDGAITDGNGGDAPSDGAPGDGSGDGEAGPAGPTLWLGGSSSLSLYGVTSDNYVIYFDGTVKTFFAQAVAGGSPIAIYALPGSIETTDPVIIGKTVFIYTFANNNVRVGPILAWSSSLAAAVPLGGTGIAYYYQTAWVSDDSQHLLFLQVSAGNSFVSDLYGANADGTGITLVASNINTYPGAIACFPRAVMRGGYAVVSYCSAADAGSVPILESFAVGSGWAPATVTTNWIASNNYQTYIENLDPSAFSFAVDPDAGRVVAASSTSADASLQVFPMDGGPGTVIDPTSQLTTNLSFAGSKTNPWSVYYNNGAGVLEQSPVSNPAPKVLADGGVNYFVSYSLDGKWVLTANQSDSTYGFGDVSLVSTVTPGSSQLLATAGEYGGLPVHSCVLRPGCAFTTDMSRVLVYTNHYQNNEGEWVFYARAASLGAAPSATQLISTGYAADTYPLRGSKILVLDNFQDTDAGAGTPQVDLHIADPSTSAPATLVASGLPFYYMEVPQTYVVTSDLSTIFYKVTQGAAPGIYKYIVP
jgi:hypothetical protein